MEYEKARKNCRYELELEEWLDFLKKMCVCIFICLCVLIVIYLCTYAYLCATICIDFLALPERA